MKLLRNIAAAALLALGTPAAALAAGEEIKFPPQIWSFSGPFGTFDRASAQRGFQVYSEVCSACHAVKQAYYRDLKGIGLSEKEVEAIAAAVMVPAIGDDGAATERKGMPSDRFRSPYANEKAARAAFNGADQLYALLVGYSDPPAGVTVGDGMYYNKYFAGHQIAMAPPLADGRVTYADGTRASVEQMSRDVTTFLAYIAEPEMETRKRLGVKVVLFLLFLTGLTYATKRKVWADVH